MRAIGSRAAADIGNQSAVCRGEMVEAVAVGNNFPALSGASGSRLDDQVGARAGGAAFVHCFGTAGSDGAILANAQPGNIPLLAVACVVSLLQNRRSIRRSAGIHDLVAIA